MMETEIEGGEESLLAFFCPFFLNSPANHLFPACKTTPVSTRPQRVRSCVILEVRDRPLRSL